MKKQFDRLFLVRQWNTSIKLCKTSRTVRLILRRTRAFWKRFWTVECQCRTLPCWWLICWWPASTRSVHSIKCKAKIFIFIFINLLDVTHDQFLVLFLGQKSGKTRKITQWDFIRRRTQRQSLNTRRPQWTPILESLRQRDFTVSANFHQFKY